MADMAALAIPTASGSFSCIVSGSSSAGDGPLGGTFVYVSGSSAATNAYAVIAPVSGVGRWIRNNASSWNQFSPVTYSDSVSYALQIFRNLGTNTFGIGADNNNAYLQSFAGYALHLNKVGNNVVLNGDGIGGATVGNTLTVTNATDLKGTLAVGGGTALRAVYTGNAVIDFPSIVANSVTNMTMTVTGAGTNSVVSVSVTDGVGTDGITVSGFVSATNTVTIRAANPTAAAIDPGATVSYRAVVFQY